MEIQLVCSILESNSLAAFGKNETDLCRRFASMAAVAIEKSDATNNTKLLNQQLDVLHNVVQQKDMKEALQQIANGVNIFMGSSTCTCSITLFDEKNDRFTSTIVAAGPLAKKVHIQPRDEGKDGKGWGRYVLDHRGILVYRRR